MDLTVAPPPVQGRRRLLKSGPAMYTWPDGSCMGVFRDLHEKKLDSPFLEAILEHLESLWAYKNVSFYRQVPETFAGRTQEIYKSEN